MIEKTDTKIRIFEQHTSKNAPYTDTFQTEIFWDIMTPDPRSRQTVFRKSYHVRWFDKPLIWKIIKSFIVDEIVDFNRQLPAFF